MKLEVNLSFKRPPMYTQVVEIDEQNIIEAKLKATDMVKKIAWYAGFKENPKKVKVNQIF